MRAMACETSSKFRLYFPTMRSPCVMFVVAVWPRKKSLKKFIILDCQCDCMHSCSSLLRPGLAVQLATFNFEPVPVHRQQWSHSPLWHLPGTLALPSESFPNPRSPLPTENLLEAKARRFKITPYFSCLTPKCAFTS